MRFKDLTGTRFENFSVLERASDKILSNGKHKTQWLCKCDCGNTFVVSIDHLTLKHHPVGCPDCVKISKSVKQRNNDIGKKFNNLTIIDIKWNPHKNIAICKCDCGNICEVIKADVTSGHTKSCGCLQRKQASKVNTKNWAGKVSEYGVELLCQDYKNNKGQWVWKCKCGLCENEFSELPAKIFNGHTTSCGCRKTSAGEDFIHKYLTEQDVEFQTQYAFESCKFKQKLLFDFALFADNVLLGLIEYDGRQHYEPVDYFGGEEQFKLQQQRDDIKNQYCYQHNIPLLRIPYTDSINEIKNKIYKYYLSLQTAG